VERQQKRSIQVSEQIQNVTLVMSDGKEATYSGPAQLDPDRDHNVAGVRVSKPYQLPKGMKWDIFNIPVALAEPVTMPLGLQTEEFERAWSDWVQHRKEKRCTLTKLSVKHQLASLSQLGSAAAVKVIRRAIENGWQGLNIRDEDKRQDGVSEFERRHGVS